MHSLLNENSPNICEVLTHVRPVLGPGELGRAQRTPKSSQSGRADMLISSITAV